MEEKDFMIMKNIMKFHPSLFYKKYIALLNKHIGEYEQSFGRSSARYTETIKLTFYYKRLIQKLIKIVESKVKLFNASVPYFNRLKILFDDFNQLPEPTEISQSELSQQIQDDNIKQLELKFRKMLVIALEMDKVFEDENHYKSYLSQKV